MHSLFDKMTIVTVFFTIYLPSTELTKLQRLKNTAARLIVRVGRFDHITATLWNLHWIPIAAILEFKILFFMYKSFHNEAPFYLS